MSVTSPILRPAPELSVVAAAVSPVVVPPASSSSLPQPVRARTSTARNARRRIMSHIMRKWYREGRNPNAPPGIRFAALARRRGRRLRDALDRPVGDLLADDLLRGLEVG